MGIVTKVDFTEQGKLAARTKEGRLRSKLDNILNQLDDLRNKLEALLSKEQIDYVYEHAGVDLFEQARFYIQIKDTKVKQYAYKIISLEADLHVYQLACAKLSKEKEVES